MTDDEKQDVSSIASPTTRTKDDEARLFWSRSVSLPERSLPSQRKQIVPSIRPHYLPPDTLMYPLLSAIQRKSWVRAKRLCHEVIACEPERKIYHELYLRLDQITKLANQRHQSRTTAASSASTIVAETAGDNSSSETV
ncbi:unnamed protein product [Adineta ricciae]|uniref:Uncharacterized protein n=1 Tax=Adineta ricciae TaxID=249248 RepID=A0A814UK19_ADIRI|nr:unnamed protein product [Adineta ricciae]CAF1463452.1 unnamed protein product [Adineta ricciae]